MTAFSAKVRQKRVVTLHRTETVPKLLQHTLYTEATSLDLWAITVLFVPGPKKWVYNTLCCWIVLKWWLTASMTLDRRCIYPFWNVATASKCSDFIMSTFLEKFSSMSVFTQRLWHFPAWPLLTLFQFNSQIPSCHLAEWIMHVYQSSVCFYSL